MKFLGMILAMILVFLAITFSMQNTSSILLRYYDYVRIEVPVYFLVFVAFCVGVIFAGLMGVVERFKLRRALNKSQREIKDLEKELYDSRKAQLSNDQIAPPLKKEYLS